MVTIELLPWEMLAGAGMLLLLAVLALLALLRRRPADADARGERLMERLEALERGLRGELADTLHGLRRESAESASALRGELARSHEALRTALARDAAAGRSESAESLARFSANFAGQLQGLIAINERRLAELRDTVEQRLQALQADNGVRLEEMRRTVDEKLHATLEQRLDASFRMVSDRLEAVHKGLGEMQALAAGVGDLKRVLTNVKTRGTWGEVQLARLLEDIMTPEQYAANVKPVPGSEAMVEFAIRLPGRAGEADGAPVWLPLDAKFPKEEYERLGAAQDAADAEAARAAAAALARAVEAQAKLIAARYVAPPHTTDFAIMFLPTEGLYAEVMRQPGLLERLHRLRVNAAGPSTLAALLNSLQMGFRTLAIERRSSEVWQVLRAVKTEFARFGTSLASVRKTLDSASSKIGQTEVRTRAMLRNLKDVEALPGDGHEDDPHGEGPGASSAQQDGEAGAVAGREP